MAPARIGTIVVRRRGGMVNIRADGGGAWCAKGNHTGCTFQAQLTYSRIETWTFELVTFYECVSVRFDNEGAELEVCKLIALFQFRLLVLTHVRPSE